MTYLFVGAGQAGSAIVDAIFDHTDDSVLGLFDSPDIETLGRPMVVNSTIRDLQNLSNVPKDDQYGIAEQQGFVAGTEPGFEEMVTGGFGRNPVKANEVMDEHAHQLQSILDETFGGSGRNTLANSLQTDGGDPIDDPFDESDDEDPFADATDDPFGDEESGQGSSENPFDDAPDEPLEDDPFADDDPAQGETDDPFANGESFDETEEGPIEESTAASEDETSAEEQSSEKVDAELGDEATDNENSIQYVFLFLGLGGGTGCGIAPHIAREIRDFTDGRAKIIGVGILPNTRNADESAGEDDVTAGRQAWNARYGLDRLEETVDGIVLVDNQRISYLDSAGGQFGEYNEYVADALYDLIAGPAFSSVDPSAIDSVDTPDIDVRDLVTSLSFGIGTDDSQPGYAAIGRSVTMTRSLSGYLLPFVGRSNVDSGVLTQLATSKQTLADVDSADAKKAISLVRVPESMIGRGDRSIETGTIKQYLQERCALTEVNLGVAISERRLASVTTLFTYRREDLDRLDEIDRVATAYEEETEELLA